jgi:hypothetical protein
MNGSDKINCIYEFKTPNGFLPIGFEHKSIPIIFSHINENTQLRKNTIIRPTSVGQFEIADNVSMFFDVLNFKKSNFSHKLISELNDDEINNQLNVLFITSLRSETILDYVKSTDVTDILSKKTIQLIKNNTNFKIVFIDEKEGGFFHDKLFFDKLYQLYNHLGLLSNDQLIYITNSTRIDSEYVSYLMLNNIPSFMKVSALDFYILTDPGYSITKYKEETQNKHTTVLDRGISYNVPAPHELSNKRNKYFLNLNRNSGRLHRPKIVLELIKRNLFSKGLISLLKSNEFDNFCKLPENKIFDKLIGEKYPFVVDYEDQNEVADMHNFLTKKDMWLNSYFSVVSETSVDQRFTFITEKTIRPIIYYHPFIVWGNPFTLKRLRELGFETFPELFDESYDTILDETKRMEKIIHNIESLCNKPLSELHSIYISIIPKLVKNHQHLIYLYESNTLYKNLLTILS